MQSAIYEGWVRHRRTAPRAHAFRYRATMLYLDLDELDAVFRGARFWSVERPNLGSFRRRDFLGDPHRPLIEAVRDRVEARTGERPRGPVRMLTVPRSWGHAFNPVTFYYCFSPDGTALEAIVAEITNTPWGERHAYVLTRSTSRGVGRVLRWRFDKSFHVSPFMPMDLACDWRFGEPGARLHVHMENHREGASFFDATLVLERRPLTGAALDRTVLLRPWAGLRMLVAIYGQALRLWLKRVPVHRHPRHPRVAAEGSPHV